MPYTRDPVSELFDSGARILLARTYARPGQWVGTRVVYPAPRQLAWAAGLGINLTGTDQWGRDRWTAAFVRAVYYQHKWYYAQGKLGTVRRMTVNDSRGLQYELGRRLPVLGIIPAGRAVRIRTRPGGDAAMKAVKKMPDQKRIYADDGSPAGRWADPTERDW
jgi:hypothetical protein